jgi:shikimate kinase
MVENMHYSKKNIILIGMPGCGKSTIGSYLSKLLNLNFIDLDEYIEKKYNISIAEIFTKGEDHFRKLETLALGEVCKNEGSIIATGGGIVKKDDNFTIMNENGFIIFIDRPVQLIMQDIDVNCRPLLKENKNRLFELYNERITLYKACCHVEVINDTTFEDIIKKITDIYKSIE